MVNRPMRFGCPALSAAVLAAWCCAQRTQADPQAPPEIQVAPAAKAPKIEAGADTISLPRRVDAYVRAITQRPGLSDDGLLVRWNTPICLQVLGLAPNEARSFSERLAQLGASAGAPLAKTPCQPNLVIIATAEPDRVLSAWYARDPRLFRDATPARIRQFIEGSKSHPVRVWYNIDTGRKSGVHNGHFVPSNTEAESSVFAGNTGFDFFSVFAIVDTARAAGHSWDELAAYVALAGLTNVNLDAELGGAPSILSLFTPSSDQQASGLSSWDSAFLRALYQSNQMSRTRRFDITERIVRELSR